MLQEWVRQELHQGQQRRFTKSLKITNVVAPELTCAREDLAFIPLYVQGLREKPNNHSAYIEAVKPGKLQLL